jgi:plastocyanin
MKLPLKRRLNLFPKLRRRLSSVQWILLLITTAMFFLSAASNACTFSLGGGGGGGTVVGAASPGGSTSPPGGGGAPAPAASSPAAAAPAPAASSPAAAAPAPAASSPAAAAPAPAASSPAAPAGGAPPAAGGAQEIDAVAMKDAKHAAGFAFSPETLTIKKGTKVTWVNKTKAPHNVTSDKATGAGSFTSSAPTALSPGGPTNTTVGYSFTFAMAGTYTYSCTLHDGQVGTITVT